MGTYTPAAVVPVTALTAVGGTSVLTGTAAHTYIMRTIHVSTSGSGKTFTLSIGADAVGKRLFDGVALTQAVPSIYNGWWPVTGAGAHDIDANCAATTVQLYAGGYDFA